MNDSEMESREKAMKKKAHRTSACQN